MSSLYSHLLSRARGSQNQHLPPSVVNRGSPHKPLLARELMRGRKVQRGSFRAVNAGVISAMLRFLQRSAFCSFSVIGSGQSVKCVLDVKSGDSLRNLHVSGMCAEEQNGVFIPFWMEARQGEGIPQSLVIKNGPTGPWTVFCPMKREHTGLLCRTQRCSWQERKRCGHKLVLSHF